MKNTRLFAMLLAATVSFSSIPVANVNAAAVSNTTGGSYVSAAVKSADEIQLTASAANKKPGTNTRQKLGWQKKNKKWYYLTKKGYTTGWARIDKVRYFFDQTGVMQTGWVTEGGKKFYLNKSGAMLTGWHKIKKKWYYFDKSGAMQTGWLKLKKRTFYLKANGSMQTGWHTENGKRYYFGKDGAMYAGPHVYKIGKKYYFFEKDGCLTTKAGKRYSDQNNLFYVNADGTVVTNKDLGKSRIGSDGVTVIKTDNEMDAKAQGYDSKTKYLILADLSAHEMTIYKGRKGAWKRIKGTWSFTCGAPANHTPTGIFKLVWPVQTEYGWKNFKLSRACYVYWTSAGFMLHSVLYSLYGGLDPDNVSIVDGRLGMNLSLSCIRLEKDNAKYIYENIPTQTTLVVYK